MGNIKKFDCEYLDKKSFDLKELMKKASCVNINDIADELNINHQTVYGYTSVSKRYSKVKVPKVFIDKLVEKVEEVQRSADQINERINELN